MEVSLFDNGANRMGDALQEACSAAELVRVEVAFAQGSGLNAAMAPNRAVTR
jgi:hypothetical protein